MNLSMSPDAKVRAELRAQMPDYITGLRDAARQHAPEAVSAREAGYTIRNAAGDDGPAVVRIYDEIWWLGVNALDLSADLDQITAAEIRVEINSPGGDVFDGITIYNALRNHPAHVTTRVDGLAASIASIIAQAGDHRIMQPSAQMMIHNAWGLAVGDTNDHADMAKVLAQQDEILAGIYASASGGDASHFAELMADDTWLTAERAVAEGLADEIVDPAPKAPRNTVKPSFHDKITSAVNAVEEAITSADQVIAVRAEVGKELSNKNREGLSGLRAALERLDGLLPEETPTPEGDVWTPDKLAETRARYDAHPNDSKES